MYKSLMGVLSTSSFIYDKECVEEIGLRKQSTNSTLTLNNKVDMIYCVRKYDIPEVVIISAGADSDEYVRDKYDEEYVKSADLKTYTEKETMFWGVWIHNFIVAVTSDTDIDQTLLVDIRNKRGCVYDNIKRVANSNPENQFILDWASKL